MSSIAEKMQEPLIKPPKLETHPSAGTDLQRKSTKVGGKCLSDCIHGALTLTSTWFPEFCPKTNSSFMLYLYKHSKEMETIILKKC